MCLWTGGTGLTVQEGSRKQPCLTPDIKSLCCVPASMTQLFLESGHKNNSTLEGSEVQRIITDYAKRNNLVDAGNRNLVRLDPTLCDCIFENNGQHLVMKYLRHCRLTKCLKNLQPAYQATFPGQAPVLQKGKVYPTDIILTQNKIVIKR